MKVAIIKSLEGGVKFFTDTVEAEDFRMMYNQYREDRMTDYPWSEPVTVDLTVVDEDNT